MKSQQKTGALLNELAFTSKEVADFAGISESMVKKIKLGITDGSLEVQQKIEAFVQQKIEQVQMKLKSHHSSTLFDVV